jgi:hypothetical protein
VRSLQRHGHAACKGTETGQADLSAAMQGLWRQGQTTDTVKDGMNDHPWTRYLTNSVRVGIAFTVLSAGALIILLFVTREFYSTAFFASIIVFQLSFIWTCAEILDGPDESDTVNDEPHRNDFTH